MRPSILITSLLLAASSVQGYVYCHFYANGDCTGKQSVNFNVANSNCFKAAGKSYRCHGTTIEAFKLVQSPNNNGKCNCQNHCTDEEFEKVGSADHCHNLNDLGFNTKYHTYRFISSETTGVKCGPNNC